MGSGMKGGLFLVLTTVLKENDKESSITVSPPVSDRPILIRKYSFHAVYLNISNGLFIISFINFNCENYTH